MAYSYPLLKKVFDHYGKSKGISDVYLVCCQHLLEPQAKMFEYLITLGFDPKKILVLGKIYSTNKEVFASLAKKDVQVFQPPFTEKSFDEEHRDNCKKLLELVPKNANVIVMDDGGELIKLFSESNRNVLFAVEQTSSGFRKLEKESLPFPMINVARSSTKLVQESPLVAHLCYERIRHYTQEKRIADPSFLVVGLGPIGEAILQIFKQSGDKIEGFDLKKGHSDLLAYIKTKKPTIIIGATDSRILEQSDIKGLLSLKSIYCISVSSSDREFPVVPFRTGQATHEDVTYKNITFVNNGFPITFKGNKTEMTAMEIEKTICLLAGSVAHGIMHPFKQKGIIDVPQELETIVNS